MKLSKIKTMLISGVVAAAMLVCSAGAAFADDVATIESPEAVVEDVVLAEDADDVELVIGDEYDENGQIIEEDETAVELAEEDGALQAAPAAEKSSFDAYLNKDETSIRVGCLRHLELRNSWYTPTWKSDNPKIARVNSNGSVRGIKPGSTWISARAGGNTYWCYVTVRANSKNISDSYTGYPVQSKVVKAKYFSKEHLIVKVRFKNNGSRRITFWIDPDRTTTISFNGKVVRSKKMTSKRFTLSPGQAVDFNIETYSAKFVTDLSKLRTVGYSIPYTYYYN